MATEVELSGMTINLVPDKATYDGMVKNPNEMYLVQDDYDMAVEIDCNPNSAISTDGVMTGEVIYGSVTDVVNKLNNNPNYIAKIFIKANVYYGTALYTISTVTSPWVEWLVNGSA